MTAKKPRKGVSKLKLDKRKRGKEQDRFLAEYAKCGNILLAAKLAKIERAKHYDWLEADPDYESKFAVAHESAAEALEAEAHRRAVTGVQEPVWYQGQKCGHIRKFSDTLLIFLMKGAMPDKYAEFVRANIQHKIISRGPDLSILSEEQFEQLKALAGYTGNGSKTLTALAGSPGDSGGGAEAGEEQDPEVLP